MIKHLLLAGILWMGLTVVGYAQTGIGTTTPDGSAVVDLTSTTKGFLQPRMTEVQRDSIINPAMGLMIYNTTTGRMNLWNGTGWQSPILIFEPSAPRTFSFTASTQFVIVPSNMDSVTVDASGASGGGFGGGGSGARVQATLPVHVGDTLFINVGGAGGSGGSNQFGLFGGAGGYNGGGSGNWISFSAGSGGGGATDIRVGGGNALANRVLVAGGGGASGGGSAGGKGGDPIGAAGAGVIFTGPAGGAGGGLSGGGSGVLGAGGNGFNGGGGGYYGGGNGSYNTVGGNPHISGAGGGSSWVNPNSANVQYTSPYNSGNGNVTLTFLPVKDAPVMDGSNISGVNAANLTGTYAALNGNAITNINAANLTGTLPALNGGALTNLNAANLSGTLPALNGNAVTNLNAANLSGTLPALNGNAVTNLNAANLTGTLPALNGNAITNVNAANLTGSYAALNGNAITNVNAANLTGTYAVGNGNAITNLNAANLTGTYAVGNGNAITNLNAASLTGTYAAGNGSAITNLNAASLTGTYAALDGNAITNLKAANLTGTYAALNGNAITNVNAANLTGTYAGLNGSAITNLNAANLIGTLPALDGSNLSNLTETDPKVGSITRFSLPRWNSTISKLETGSLYDSSGRIGLGTKSPLVALHIKGAGDQEISIESTGLNARRWSLQSNATSAGLNSTFQIIDRAAGAARISIDNSGNIGIGTVNPAARLDVAGTFSAANWASESVGPLTGASPSGFARMGDVIIAWGTVNYTSNNAVAVTLPTTFANIFSVTATVVDANAAASGANVACKITNLTNAGFKIAGTATFSGDGFSTVKWIAIGN